MALFENFPYTNLHNLNLDWIIQELKKIDDDYNYIKDFIPKIPEIEERLDALDQLPDQFEDFKDEITDDFDTFTSTINAWKAQVNSQLASLEQLVNSFMNPCSNIICLTDSYGTDSEQNNRLSWCSQLRDMLGLTNNVTYRKVYEPGASFGNVNANKCLYDIFVNGTASLTTEQKNAVSDIIIEAGVNDWFQDKTNAITNMGRLNTYIRANFPNARISLFGCGWDKVAEIRYALYGKANSVYNYYKETAASLKWFCVINISAMVNKNNYVDDTHPNTEGSKQIATIIYEALKHGNTACIFNQYVRYPVSLVTVDHTRTLGHIYFDGANYVISNVTVACDALPALESGFTAMIKLGEIVTDAILGYDSSTTPSPWGPIAKLGLYINNTWYEVEGRLMLKYEVVDSVGHVYLYFRNNASFSEIPTPAYGASTISYLAFSDSIIPIYD